MKKVIFIELPTARKEQYIVDIVERIYALGKTIHIFGQNKDRLQTLDRLLWIRKPDSFLPHGIYNPSEPLSFDEIDPILLIPQAVNFSADFLILHDPLSVEQIGDYRTIIDFAEIYDKHRLQDSRKRYVMFRNSGEYELAFEKLGSFYKLIKAS